MGGGGLLQLVAYGAQDIYLTGNPQITFFKVVYRRHTNFAIESIQNTFNGTAGFGKRVVCQISRNGDLVWKIYLQIDLPALSANSEYASYPGLRLLQDVEIEIGGQRIDKHYSYWMYIWNELSLPISKRYGYQLLTGDGIDANYSGIYTVYVPLEFWFCRNVGLALPLIALQYHEVKINIDFEVMTNMLQYGSFSNGSDLANAQLWVDYIFLDTDERRRYAQLSHEYLIEQLQFTGDYSITSSTNNIKLNFNHPCKELIWVVQPSAYAQYDWTNFSAYGSSNYTLSGSNLNSQTYFAFSNFTPANLTTATSAITTTYALTGSNYVSLGHSNYFGNSNITYNYTSNFSGVVEEILESGGVNFYRGFSNIVDSAQIKLNGQDRFYIRAGNYFNLVQPYQHHTNISQNVGINMYSFALKPEEHQPSGTLNLSRIDTAVLVLNTSTINSSNPAIVKIYAVNYNVLRIMSGMGGLAYSN